MVEPPLSDYEVIRFLVQRGGRCTNYELVSNFRQILNDPQHQAEARLKFKDIINSVATVAEFQNVKYIELKKEYIFTKPQSEVLPTSGHSSLPHEINASPTYHSPLTNNFQPYWRYRLSTSPQLPSPIKPDAAQQSQTLKSFNRSVSETTLIPERPTRAIRSSSEVKSQSPSSDLQLPKEHNDHPVRRLSSCTSNESHRNRRYFSNHIHSEQIPFTDHPESLSYISSSSSSQATCEPKSERNLLKELSFPTYSSRNAQHVSGKELFDKLPTTPPETRLSGRNETKNLDLSASAKNISERVIVTNDINYDSESLKNNNECTEKQVRASPTVCSVEGDMLRSAPKMCCEKREHETRDEQQSGVFRPVRNVTNKKERKNMDDPSETRQHERKDNIMVNKEVKSSKVKDRVQHFDEMEKKQQRITPSGGKENKISYKNTNVEDDVSISVLDSKLKKEWFVKSSQCDYQALVALLKKEPKLAALKDVASGYNALHWAAKHGDANVVKLIAGAYKVNPNIRSNGGYTPVHLASLYKHNMIGHLLIHTYGADPSLRDYNGRRADQYPCNYIRRVAGQKNVERRPLKQRPLVAKEGNSFMRIGSLNLRKARKSTVFASNRNWASTSELGFGSVRKKREKKSVAEDSDSDSAYGFPSKN